MIRMLRQILWFILIAVVAEILQTGCSERASEPVILPDSTIVFPSKKADDISAKIAFCKKQISKTGRRTGEGTIFTIREGESVNAVVDLENRFLSAKRDLMFHIDWIDPEGRSFYLKRIDLLPGDSTSALNSAVSISPDKRQPGAYFLRIYLFRELIAEKKFTLITESQAALAREKGIKANIILYKSTDKATGERKGVDTVFTIKDKAKIRAFIDLENRYANGDKELNFNLDWTGPDGKSFFSKQIDLPSGDTTTTINSSISISPDKRLPGKCFLRVYLFDEMISERRFELIPGN
jgi:hypothetical protein